jgi:predicted AlkP superfamily phosphohydrolase/phosphomutase
VRQVACLVLARVLSAGAEEPSRRVLLIGVDGASPRMTGSLIEAGRLPNLARLAREGASGSLRAFPPLYSPRIWGTIATGKVPEKHGILSFSLDDADGASRLFDGRDRVGAALWNIASRAGLGVGVVNYWNTYPPEVVDGVIVSDHFLPEAIAARRELLGLEDRPDRATIYPASWRERIESLRESGVAPVPDPDPFRGPLPPWADADFLSRVFQEDGLVARIALEIEAAERPGLLIVFLPGVDRVSHVLWGTLAPRGAFPEHLRGTPALRRAGAEALRAYYDYVDALVGALLERFSADDLVMVVSDHGFEVGVTETPTGDHTGRHVTSLAAEGVLFARGPGIAPGSAAGPVTVNDVTPTILSWLGLPTAEDMDGEPAAFLEAPRPPSIETYDTVPVERIGVGRSGSEEEIRGRLRALGYVE